MLRRREQLVTPVDGGAQRLLPRRQVAGTAREELQGVLEAGGRSAAGDSILTRAAASSMARGALETRADGGHGRPRPEVRRKPEATAAAPPRRGRRRAGGPGARRRARLHVGAARGEKANSRSAETWSAARLVTSTFRRGPCGQPRQVGRRLGHVLEAVEDEERVRSKAGQDRFPGLGPVGTRRDTAQGERVGDCGTTRAGSSA